MQPGLRVGLTSGTFGSPGDKAPSGADCRRARPRPRWRATADRFGGRRVWTSVPVSGESCGDGETPGRHVGRGESSVIGFGRWARVTRTGLSACETSKGPHASRGSGFGCRNAMDPRTGCGMQQARRARMEQAVEVVRNHGDGTRDPDGSGDPKGGLGRPGVDMRVSERSTRRDFPVAGSPAAGRGPPGREGETVEGRQDLMSVGEGPARAPHRHGPVAAGAATKTTGRCALRRVARV